MMDLFKKKKSAEAESAAATEEAERNAFEGEQRAIKAEQSAFEQAWFPGEAAPAPDGDFNPHAYQPWSADDAEPPPLVMKEPQANESELQEIANAGSLDEQIVAALKKVYDPEIPVDIYEMGLVYGVDVSPDKVVAIQMTLTSPGCPVAEQMPGMVEHAVRHFVKGVRDVEVEIVWDPPWTPDRMSEAAQLELGFI